MKQTYPYTQTYRRVLWGDAMDKIGTTHSWYQVGGPGWLYGFEVKRAAKVIRIRFCYW